MTERTDRLALPLILPGQAQKEAYHNEALTLLDGFVHAAVEGAPVAMPPASPGEGQCWIVGASPGGAWAGQAGKLALWSAGGWRFLEPVPGTTAWDMSGGHWRSFDGTQWLDGLPPGSLRIGGQRVVGPRLPSVPSPSGGTTIDAEARTAVDSLIVTLKSHGLID